MKRPRSQDYLFVAHLLRSDIESNASERIQENVNSTVVLRVLMRNKVPLVFLDRLMLEQYPEVFQTEDFRGQYYREKIQFSKQRKEWARIKNHFDKAGIETMLIKSVGSFPYKSSNLDVLIKQDKRQEAESILESNGYIQLHNVEEPFKTLFRTFEDGKPSSVIHLHNKVAWINPFHDEQLLWPRYRRSSQDDLVDIPSPEDSILILTAHWLYEDKEIKLSDIMNISTCLRRRDLDWEYMKEVTGKLGWRNGLYFGLLVQSFMEKTLYGESSIQDGHLEKFRVELPTWMRNYLNKKVYSREISLPFKLPKILGKFLHFIKVLKHNATTPSQKLLEMYMTAYSSFLVVLFEKFKVNIRYQPPMLIALSGVDGSGKTTYANILFEAFVVCEIRVRYVWSRVGSSVFIKPFSIVARTLQSLRARWAKTELSDYCEDRQSKHKSLFIKSRVLRTVGLFILLSEMLWQYWFKVKLPLLFHSVVICDRYLYDTITDIRARYGLSAVGTCTKLFEKILKKLTPRADIAYVLLVSPEEVLKHGIFCQSEVKLGREQVDIYEVIAEKLNLRRIYREKNTSISDIGNIMVNETLIEYYRKWSLDEKGTKNVNR